VILVSLELSRAGAIDFKMVVEDEIYDMRK